eukprot:COSAG02_NODE_55351_length_291_cov_0.567708_2_plen_43_part_01
MPEPPFADLGSRSVRSLVILPIRSFTTAPFGVAHAIAFSHPAR